MTRLAFFRPGGRTAERMQAAFMPSVKERLRAVLTDDWRPGSLE
jgi:hypothetical protein